MKDSTDDKLREYVSDRVRREIAERLGAGSDIPEAHRRVIVEDGIRAGAEEVDYTIRRLVRRAARRRRRFERKQARSQALQRFSLTIRIQHAILASSVLVLIATGLPIKFHETWLGDIVHSLGMVDAMKITHRVAAAAMTGVSLWHVIWVVFTREGWSNFVNLLPRPQDGQDLWAMTRHLTGRGKGKPRFGRFAFNEKFDYWAVYWGVIIMAGTGALLFFNTYFMNLLGPYSMHIAKLIHSDEALLASLALIIWHFYWAHFNPAKFPINKVIFTGEMSLEEMIDEHPAELEERIRRGEVPREILEEHPEWLALHPDNPAPPADEIQTVPEGALP